MYRDQALGWLIFVVSLVLAAGWLVLVFAPHYVSGLIGIPTESLRFWAVASLVIIVFLSVMFIGAWIGWTLATTLPPKTVRGVESDDTETKEKA